MGFRADINALRALAVVSVVLYHFGVSGAGGGFAGVDVFFVISGFLMTRIMAGRSEPMLNAQQVFGFYLSRARRIVPALAVMVATVLLLGWSYLDPSDYARLADHAKSSLLFVSNLTYTHESGYFDSASNTKWLLHTWSLSVEWMFYLLIPIVFVVFNRLRLTSKQIALCILGAAVALYLNCGLSTPGNPTKYFYGLTSRSWELLVGCLVYYASSVQVSDSLRRLFAWGGLTLVVACVAFCDTSMIWPGWSAAVPVLGAAMIILANVNYRWLSNGVVQWLGDRSYSIYLWHWPVCVFLVSIGKLNSLPHVLVSGLVILAISECSYRFIEQPGRRVLSALPLGLSGVAAWVLIGLVVPQYILQTDGALNRFAADVPRLHDLEAARNDWEFPGSPSVDVPPTVETRSTTVILGDSHAQQWYKRVSVLENRPSRVLFITHGGCLPIPGFERYESLGKCDQFGEDGWREAIKLHPKRIVVIASWLLYFTKPNGEYDNDSCVVSDSGCDRVKTEKEMNTLMESLRAELVKAKAAGIKTYVLDSIPQSDFSYLTEESRQISEKHLLFRKVFRHPQKNPWINERFVRAWGGPVGAKLRAVASSAGAIYVDPIRYMCDKGICPVTDGNGLPLYKDTSHLRASAVTKDQFRWFDQMIF